jgi:hypothetical protein
VSPNVAKTGVAASASSPVNMVRPREATRAAKHAALIGSNVRPGLKCREPSDPSLRT